MTENKHWSASTRKKEGASQKRKGDETFATLLEMYMWPIKSQMAHYEKLFLHHKTISEEEGMRSEREDGGFGWRERWPAALLCSL